MTRRRHLLHDVWLVARALMVVARVRVDLARHQHDQLRARIAALARSHPISDKGSDADLAEVAWSVAAASRLVPGATCLTQATAGQILLIRRGRVSIVRLSLPVDGGAAEDFRPHAWLIAAERILLGGTAARYAQHRAFCDFLPEGRESPVQQVAA